MQPTQDPSPRDRRLKTAGSLGRSRERRLYIQKTLEIFVVILLSAMLCVSLLQVLHEKPMTRKGLLDNQYIPGRVVLSVVS